jgi:hypothetical protein
MATGAEEAVAEVWADWQDAVNMTKPSGDVSDSPWRYSLMNWGHDPTK